LAESLTVNGEIVLEDDIDRGAMAEYVKVLAVIDEAIEQALAAPTVQEPVADAWMHKDGRLTDAKAKTARVENFHGWRPLAFIASAAQPAPVPLTDEQINTIRFSIPTKAVTQRDFELARAIEAAHGIPAAPEKGN
jgi:hypothetical protein